MRCRAIIPGIGQCELQEEDHEFDGLRRPIHVKGAIAWNGDVQKWATAEKPKSGFTGLAHSFRVDLLPSDGELVLYAILGAFFGYELVAHFTHYRYGRTLSAIILAGDHSKILALMLFTRAAVILGAIALVLHLEGLLW